MSKITIKTNSFANQNTVLVDDSPVQINSEFMSYYSRPIIKSAEKILSAAAEEFNDDFDVEVFGNLFEQKFLQSLCQEYEFCNSCSTHYNDIAIPTVERLKLLEKQLDDIKIPLSILSDSVEVALPELPGIQFDGSSGESIIISDNMDYIRSHVSGNTVIAFLLNGKGSKIRNTYIIGCNQNEVKDLVYSFIDTYYINPIINKKASAGNLSGDQVLVNRTEPYFYVDEQFVINYGEELELPIKSIPEDADKSRIRCFAKGELITLNNLSVKGEAPGKCLVEFYYDSPISFASTSITVIKHNLINDIDIFISFEGDTLSANRSYPITVDFAPRDAEDAKEIEVSVSGTASAEIKDKNLIVKTEGFLHITAKTAQVCKTITLNVLPALQSITLSEASKKLYFGDVFEVEVATQPNNAFNSNYRWVTSDKSVAVVGVDNQGRELIKATGIGKTTIKCISVDDENIFAEMEIVVASTFEKREKQNVAKIIGIVAAILSYLFIFISDMFLYWSAIAISVIFLIIHVIKNKRIADAIGPGVIVALSILLFFYISNL